MEGVLTKNLFNRTIRAIISVKYLDMLVLIIVHLYLMYHMKCQLLCVLTDIMLKMITYFCL
jgi:hypothetical protein